MKTFELDWTSEVSYSVTIKAEDKEDALRLWRDGKYDLRNMIETDSQVIEDPTIDEDIDGIE